MKIHLGNDVNISSEDIHYILAYQAIGNRRKRGAMFDYDKSKIQYLCEEKMARSFVVTADKVYVTSLSNKALGKKINDLQGISLKNLTQRYRGYYTKN